MAALAVLACVTGIARPAYASGPTTTTTPLLGAGATTTTTTTVAPPTSVAPTTSTTAPGNGKTPPATGVPSIPVGGPPTTVAKKGAKPAPPPNPAPILTEVQGYLSQVAAINQYQAAKNLVQAEQSQVAAAQATVATAASALSNAQETLAAARAGQATADTKLRALAVAAYIGVGFTSTQLPSGGVASMDSKELLLLVSQHIVANDNDAKAVVAQDVGATGDVEKQYRRTVSALHRTQSALASAQHLMLVDKSIATSGAGTALTSSGDPAATNIPSPSILGSPILSAAEMAAWYASTGQKANTTVPIGQLAQDYQDWGQKLGVRDDIAFAQSIVETGYFTFPSGGQLTGKDNNFAGIGACDSCSKGWSFPDASTGVGAQLELLYEYATTSPLPSSVANVIGASGIGGCCTTWSQLAGKWASSTVYGISIMTVYQQMLAWAIPRREVTAGLVKPAPTTTTTLKPAKAKSPSTTAPAR